jgi:glycerophosphoryl diester phosphodiesterase
LHLEILAHRGWWHQPEEKNSRTALARAFAAGYGVETDLRDCAGEIVVSHDMPQPGAMTFDELLDLYLSYPTRPTLALNVKADGMAETIAGRLAARGITQYFVFDMSVPDTLGYLAQGMTVFTRHSEYETGSSLDARAAGIWLDAFEQPFVITDDIDRVLGCGQVAALVSPELHRKPHEDAWRAWRDALAARTDDARVMLCTDLPDRAQSYFTA